MQLNEGKMVKRRWPMHAQWYQCITLGETGM